MCAVSKKQSSPCVKLSGRHYRTRILYVWSAYSFILILHYSLPWDLHVSTNRFKADSPVVQPSLFSVLRHLVKVFCALTFSPSNPSYYIWHLSFSMISQLLCPFLRVTPVIYASITYLLITVFTLSSIAQVSAELSTGHQQLVCRT